jgi:hypothetical protein
MHNIVHLETHIMQQNMHVLINKMKYSFIHKLSTKFFIRYIQNTIFYLSRATT